MKKAYYFTFILFNVLTISLASAQVSQKKQSYHIKCFNNDSCISNCKRASHILGNKKYTIVIDHRSCAHNPTNKCGCFIKM